MCISGADKFTDITRKNICGSATNSVEASAIFDTALAMASVFHIIEWCRQAIFMTTVVIGVNLMGWYYALSINIPYGIIAMIYAIITRYSEDGTACAEEGLQIERANFLQLQIVCLLLYPPMCLLPVWIFKAKGIKWLE